MDKEIIHKAIMAVASKATLELCVSLFRMLTSLCQSEPPYIEALLDDSSFVMFYSEIFSHFS